MIVPDDAQDVNLERLDPEDFRRSSQERYHVSLRFRKWHICERTAETSV